MHFLALVMTIIWLFKRLHFLQLMREFFFSDSIFLYFAKLPFLLMDKVGYDNVLQGTPNYDMIYGKSMSE